MSKIQLRGLDLNLLQLFHTVYLERSVSVAASRLGLTQSAVSHGLRKLREVFADPLFVRAGAAMTPTARAQQLFEPVQELITSVETRILPAVTFNPAQAVREFSLAMVDLAEVVVLPHLLKHLKHHAPHCTLRTQRIANTALLENLEDGRIELALFAYISEVPRHIYRQTLFHHDFVVLAWAEHPRLQQGLTSEDYQREQHVVVASGPDQALREHTLNPQGLQRQIKLTVGGYLSVPWLLIGTEMIATVPSHVAIHLSSFLPLRQFPLPIPTPVYPLVTLWHPRSHNDAGHRWLRTALYEVMRHYPEMPEMIF